MPQKHAVGAAKSAMGCGDECGGGWRGGEMGVEERVTHESEADGVGEGNAGDGCEYADQPNGRVRAFQRR